MRRCVVAALLAAVCAGGFAAPASAHLQGHVGSQQRGWVALRLWGGKPHALVSVYENNAPVAQVRLGGRGRAFVRQLAQWQCGARDRVFYVRALTLTTRTPGCVTRLGVGDLRRPRAGHRFAVRLRDRWHLGGAAMTVCVVGPVGTSGCHIGKLHKLATTPVQFYAPHPGRWTVTVQGAGMSATRRLTVLPTTGTKLRLLATGDSLMIRVARHINRQIHRKPVIVQQDIHFGAAISHNFVYDWRPGSRKAAASPHPPDIVVLFLGGTEGPAFGAVPCCGPDWIEIYRKRARQIMKTYLREGAAQVYWLNLPAPEDPDRVPAFQAANQGLALAVKGFEPWVRVLDEAELLTPGFVYRYSAVINGQTVILRQSDGLHLSRVGAIMSAQMVKQAMHTDGVLP
jgi:lysophospholipase L1-like esterase